jgi:hypothetical protein
MSIINALREYLSEYDGLEMVLTDMTRGPGSYAITQSAGGTVKRDILGNKTYQNSYIFLAKEHGGDEVDRRGNYDFLESFCDWLEERNDHGDLPKLSPPYTPASVEVSNVLLMDTEEGGEATYQVQIQFVYRKNNEVKNKWLI